jgi:hypothetical protein
MFTVRHEYCRIPRYNEIAKQKFNSAIQYLKSSSELAKMLIEELEGCPKTVEVIVRNDDSGNDWRGPKMFQSNSGGTVHWYPDRVKTKENLSAELALMHELGHAYQFLSHEDWFASLVKGRVGKFLLPWRFCLVKKRMEIPAIAQQFEDPNVQLIETEVAKQLNASNNAGKEDVAYQRMRSRYFSELKTGGK